MAHKDFPAWKFHRNKPAKIVHTLAEENALGSDWQDSPFLEPAADLSHEPSPVDATEPTDAPKRKGRPPKAAE